MVAWFLNPALSKFRAEVDARWPRRDQESDGTIGDEAHQAGSSSHNPDADGSVDAWDMDVELNGRGKSYASGVEACKRAFQAHPSSSYWIHNDRIAFRDEGWQPRSYAYAGPNRNRHDKHVHWNSRQSHERVTTTFFTEVPDMTPEQAAQLERVDNAIAWMDPRIFAMFADVEKIPTTFARGGGSPSPIFQRLARIETKLSGLEETINAPAQIVLTPEQLTTLVTQVTASVVAGLKSGAFVFEELETS